MFDSILLTGASGNLGTLLRSGLAPLARRVRLSDLHPPQQALRANEEFVAAELSDLSQLSKAVEGVNAIVHMGGIPNEDAFAPILQANIVGTYHVYHAALLHGVKRVVLASTNHLSGHWPNGTLIKPEDPTRPDSLYAVSKGYGELLSRYYYDHYGIETVCLRIGSCSPRPLNRRGLAIWISEDDLRELVRCALCAPDVGHLVLWGVSDNPDSNWDNSAAAKIGFKPRHSAAAYAEDVQALAGWSADDLRSQYQGGNMLLKTYLDGGVLDENDLRPPFERWRAQHR